MAPGMRMGIRANPEQWSERIGKTIMRMHRRAIAAAAVAAAAALGLAACSSGGSGANQSSPTGGADQVQQALDKGGTVTVWAWEPTLKNVVTEFQKKYPKVKVKLVNAGTGNDQYTALQNAISAGKGVPDVAQVEYYALPQFAIGNALTDLDQFGAGDLDGTFSKGPWQSVHFNNKVYGLPMDSGPIALFYNKTVFDKYGISVPKTWDQYIAAAKKLHQANPKAYITNDTGDAGFTTTMIWQAGGTPFTTDGTNVSVNLTGDQGAQKYAALWQQLISGKLLAPISSWSDQWYKGLGDGTIATLVIGAWMPANLESGVADAAGDWRVAEVPQWSEGQHVSAENGGSALTVPAKSANQALAYAFVDFANNGAGVQTRIDGGAFPATTAQLDSEAFKSKKFEYFGGQQANQILSQSAANVRSGWQYLPFQVYANSIFNDTVGKAYVSNTSLANGLRAWQDRIVSYGNEQGFSVTGK